MYCTSTYIPTFVRTYVPAYPLSLMCLDSWSAWTYVRIHLGHVLVLVRTYVVRQRQLTHSYSSLAGVPMVGLSLLVREASASEPLIQESDLRRLQSPDLVELCRHCDTYTHQLFGNNWSCEGLVSRKRAATIEGPDAIEEASLAMDMCRFLWHLAEFLIDLETRGKVDFTRFAQLAATKVPRFFMQKDPDMGTGDPKFNEVPAAEQLTALVSRSPQTKQAEDTVSEGDGWLTIFGKHSGFTPGTKVLVKYGVEEYTDAGVRDAGPLKGVVNGYTHTAALVLLECGQQIECQLYQLAPAVPAQSHRTSQKLANTSTPQSQEFETLLWRYASGGADWDAAILKATLWHMSDDVTATVDPSKLRIQRCLGADGQSAVWSVTTIADINQGELRLVPYSALIRPVSDMEEEAECSDMVPRSYAHMCVCHRDINVQNNFHALVPRDLLATNHPETVNPFWIVPTASEYGRANLVCRTAELGLSRPVGWSSLGEGGPQLKRYRPKLFVKIPVIVNSKTLEAGTSLFLGE